MNRIRKGDEVIVTAGKNKGKRGKVKEMMLEKNRIVVEGVNMIKRHTRRGTARQAGIVEREASIAASNVMPYCAKCGKGVRVGHRELSNDNKARYCKACGENIGK